MLADLDINKVNKMMFWQPSMEGGMKGGSGGQKERDRHMKKSGNCGNKCKKDLKGWAPVRYYIMYELLGYVGMGDWESVKKVELLKNVTDEEKAKIAAGEWLRNMRKKESNCLKLKSARLVASVHKDILKLI